MQLNHQQRAEADTLLAFAELNPLVRERVKELRDTLIQARGCLLNLMPDTGPMSRQMGKMVDEINAVL